MEFKICESIMFDTTHDPHPPPATPHPTHNPEVDTHYVREMSSFRSIDPFFKALGKHIDLWHTPFLQRAGENIDFRPPFSNI